MLETVDLTLLGARAILPKNQLAVWMRARSLKTIFGLECGRTPFHLKLAHTGCAKEFRLTKALLRDVF